MVVIYTKVSLDWQPCCTVAAVRVGSWYLKQSVIFLNGTVSWLIVDCLSIDILN